MDAMNTRYEESSDGYMRVKRPDAAPPCHHEYDDFGNCEYCGKNRFVAAPSADLAVQQKGEG